MYEEMSNHIFRGSNNWALQSDKAFDLTVKPSLTSTHQTGLEVWLAYFSNSPGAVHSVPVLEKKAHVWTNVTV